MKSSVCLKINKAKEMSVKSTWIFLLGYLSL